MRSLEPSAWSHNPRGKTCLSLFTLLRHIDRETRCECKFPWLYVPKAAERLELEQKIFLELRQHCKATRHRHPKKATCDPDTLLTDETIKGAARSLRVDFYLPSLRMAVEFDERQHFSEERKVTLQCYEELPLGFDKARWMQLCSPTIQDPDPPRRDWVRAFRDAVRDIRAAEHGIKLLRIYYGDFGQAQCQMPGSVERLRSLISLA